MSRPLLRGDCKVPSTLRAIAAIGVKQGTLASRAQTGVDDAVRGQAAFEEKRDGQAGHVNVRLAARAIDVTGGVAITVLELFRHVLPHLEAADSDRGAEPRECSGRIEVSLALEKIESLRRDP